MKLEAWLQSWSKRPTREKWLLGAAAVAVVLALCDALLTGPLERRVRRQQAEVESLTARWESQRTAQTLAEPQARRLREQEAQLRERLEAARARADAVRERLNDTTRLPQTLRAITATVGAAQVLELDLAAAADAPPPAVMPVVAASAPSPQRRLYRLPISLKVSGRYDELQLLLSRIEQHAPGLHWNSIALDSERWPAIQMTLKAHVLSLEPRWGATP